MSASGEVGTPGDRAPDTGASTAPSLVRIGEALHDIAPSGVRTGVRTIDGADQATLWPSEQAAVAAAVRSRRIEFATGRALLRELLGTDTEIPVRPDRRPEFPSGIVGTLAHDQDIAVAATAGATSYRALGIDIEPTTELEADLVSLICRPEERHVDAHLVFVLKEAVYKAWSALGGRMLEHREVSVRVDHRSGDFTATILPNAVEFTGRYVTVENRHLALVTVAR